jgi:hypothetical protein
VYDYPTFDSEYLGYNIWRNPVSGMYSILTDRGQFAADTLCGIKARIRELQVEHL